MKQINLSRKEFNEHSWRLLHNGNQTTLAGHPSQLCTHRTLIQMLICRHPKPTLGKQCAPFSPAFCVYLEVRRVNMTMSLWSAQQELSARQPHVSTWDPATLGVLLIQQIPLMSSFWACLFSENAALTVQKALHKLCWHKQGCAQGGDRAGGLTQPVPSVPVPALGTQSRTPSSVCTQLSLGSSKEGAKLKSEGRRWCRAHGGWLSLSPALPQLWQGLCSQSLNQRPGHSLTLGRLISQSFGFHVVVCFMWLCTSSETDVSFPRGLWGNSGLWETFQLKQNRRVLTKPSRPFRNCVTSHQSLSNSGSSHSSASYLFIVLLLWLHSFPYGET